MSTLQVQNPINLKKAAKIAVDYFLDLYPQFDRLDANVLLEEVEEIDDGDNWLITIGYQNPAKKLNSPLTTAMGLPGLPNREYKVIKVNSKTGKVISMKIRVIK